MSTPGGIGRVRPLIGADLPALRALLDTDPVANCFVASRVDIAGADPWRLGGQLLGYVVDGTLESAVYAGANLAPVSTSPGSRAAFAAHFRREHRRCSSMLGPAEEVLDLWRLLEPAWGPCREVRRSQPLMTVVDDPIGEQDPRVRLARREDLDVLLPACIDMFTAEVGISPVAGGAGPAYKARIAELIDLQRAYVVIEGGRILFKAEVGSVGNGACQVQGVWVDPGHRGRWLAAPCLRTLVCLVRQQHAPIVSLYVNDFNTAARKAYLRSGFVQVGEFATVLF